MRQHASIPGAAPDDLGRGADRRPSCKKRHWALMAASFALSCPCMVKWGYFLQTEAWAATAAGRRVTGTPRHARPRRALWPMPCALPEATRHQQPEAHGQYHVALTCINRLHGRLNLHRSLREGCPLISACPVDHVGA